MLRYWIVFGCTVLIQVFILLHLSVNFLKLSFSFFLSLVTHTHTGWVYKDQRYVILLF